MGEDDDSLFAGLQRLHSAQWHCTVMLLAVMLRTTIAWNDISCLCSSRLAVDHIEIYTSLNTVANQTAGIPTYGGSWRCRRVRR